MPATKFDKESIKKTIIGKIQRYNGLPIEEASDQMIYRAVAITVRDQIMQRMMTSREAWRKQKGKSLYYLSIEFLMGRSMYCNMLNLLSTKEYTEALNELGIDIKDCIVFEDSRNGLIAGRASGARVIGLATTLSAQAIDELSDMTLEAVSQLSVEQMLNTTRKVK